MVRWDGRRFAPVSATAARRTAGGAAVTPAQSGPDTSTLFGAWVFDSEGCSPPTQGIIIGRNSVVVDWGGDRTTYRNTSLAGCEGGVCTFRQRGSRATWSIRQLRADRIVFSGLFGRGGNHQMEARRSGPGCLLPQ